MRQPVLVHRTWWGGVYVEELLVGRSRSPWRPVYAVRWQGVITVDSLLRQVAPHGTSRAPWRTW